MDGRKLKLSVVSRRFECYRKSVKHRTEEVHMNKEKLKSKVVYFSPQVSGRAGKKDMLRNVSGNRLSKNIRCRKSKVKNGNKDRNVEGVRMKLLNNCWESVMDEDKSCLGGRKSGYRNFGFGSREESKGEQQVFNEIDQNEELCFKEFMFYLSVTVDDPVDNE